VKKLIGLGVLLLAVGCQRQVQVSSPTPIPTTTAGGSSAGAIGGASPAEAVTMMLAAAKAEDLQAVGAVWGDTDGLTRDKWPRSDFEMRAFYVVKCLRNDRFQILSEGPAANGRRVDVVQIVKGAVSAQTNFRMVKGKNDRWLVENVELEPLTKICQMG
jgi:hypothetical protein